MIIVKIVQVTKYQYKLMSPNNTVIIDDLAFGSQYEAETWAKRYISSFPCWEYEIVMLTRE